MDPQIRHYQATDQQGVFDISADSAYFGDPVEAFLEDRQLYIDAFTYYYTEREAQYTWVADNADGVNGFLLGCIDTAHQSRQWRLYILTRVLIKALAGGYKLGHLTSSFASGMLFGMLRGEQPEIDLVAYPAHLQIDVKRGYRGQGVGRLLIEAYLEQLRGLGVRGVHLDTTSHNEAAFHLYEKIGFKQLDRRPNSFWSRRLGYKVDNLSYGMVV